VGIDIFGKILYINLNNGKMRAVSAKDLSQRFIGGRGINTWLLHENTPLGISAYDIMNPLVIGAGLLVGTLAPTACRLSIDSMNPFNGGVGSSNSGGHFATAMKLAGYSHLVLTGRSRSPSYVYINDQEVSVRDATGIWGSTTWETEETLSNDLGEDSHILSIGPAGENLAKNAAVIIDKSRAAGRCAMASIMGSKNLKAIAVRGTESIEVANHELYFDTISKLWSKVDQCKDLLEMRRYGTTSMMPHLNDIGAMPQRNFQDGYMDPEKLRKITGENLYRYIVSDFACASCPINCSHFFYVDHGPYAGTGCEGIEGNILWDFGSRLEIDDPTAIIKAHELCSRLGLDIDNVSCVLAWAFECYQRGIIGKEDTEGLELNWGNSDAALRLLEKIARREGIGDLLAEGSLRASRILGRGSEGFAIHVKGQDNMDPLRAAKGFALGVVVSPRGGGHTRGSPEWDFVPLPSEIGVKYWGVPTIDQPSSYKGKAKLVTYYEKVHAIADSLGLCYFSTNWTSPGLFDFNDFATLFTAATGWKTTTDQMMRIGSRIHHLEKTYNVLYAGFSREHDYAPRRMMEEPIKSGPKKGEILAREDWDRLLDEYYELNAWDRRTSWPTKEVLRELELDEISQRLARVGRLPDRRSS
jgi:aldehyde:ferredoxin oxidoreductase